MSPRPRSPLLFFLLLLFLHLYLVRPVHATAPAPAPTPPSLSLVRALQSELALSARARACLSARRLAISRAASRLSAARRCRYRRLSPHAYRATRAVCRHRSEARRALSTCRRRLRLRRGVRSCRIQDRAVKNAVAACLRIGWDGSGRRASCPRISSAKVALAAAEAAVCPRPGRPLHVIRGELSVAAEAARLALGLAAPVYPTIVVEPANHDPHAVVILLHGVGGLAVDARVRADFAVRSGLLPGVRFLVPQAPVQFVNFLNATIPSWYNLLANTRDGPQAVDEVIQAANNIDDIMEIQRQVYGIDPDRVLVFGISQGGGLAVTVYLRHHVGAAIAFSGFLPIEDTYPAALNDASKDAPLIMFHGEKDMIVPFPLAQLSADIIRGLGRNVTFKSFPEEDHFLRTVEQQILIESLGFAANALGL